MALVSERHEQLVNNRHILDRNNFFGFFLEDTLED